MHCAGEVDGGGVDSPGRVHTRQRRLVLGRHCLGGDYLLDTCRLILHGAGSAAQRMSARGCGQHSTAIRSRSFHLAVPSAMAL